MSTVTPIRPDGPVAHDRFDDIYDAMQGHLDALRCVRATIECTIIECAQVEGDEDFDAARGLFHRTLKGLDQLHSDLAAWHKETRT